MRARCTATRPKLRHNQLKALLKEVDQRLPACLEQLNTYILTITTRAYNNVNLVFNPILSRSPYAGDILQNLVFQHHAKSQARLFVLAQVSRFYCRCLLLFLHYVTIFVGVKIARRTPTVAVRSAATKLTVIDTFALVDPILRDGTYIEKYFPSLPRLLQELEIAYVIFPVLDRYPLSLIDAIKVVKTLWHSEYPIVTEFDLLGFSDLAALARFIIRYPLDVIALAKSVRCRSEIDDLLCGELIATLHQSQAPVAGFIRYVSAKRLANSANCHINLISWCENRVLDKGLYRGFRECASSASIYACQNYVAYPAYLSMRIAESEIEAQVTPDYILVNGPAFLHESGKFQYRLGPSLRYQWIYSGKDKVGAKSTCVICLSYFTLLSSELIGVCSASALLRGIPIPVRAHPAYAKNTRPHLPTTWYYTKQEVPQLLAAAAVLITSESGTALEAVAVGTSVIIIASQSSFTCNPLMDIGKGEIWDLAYDSLELDAIYSRLVIFRRDHPSRIEELASLYKSQCFVEPTVENIKLAFDL